MLRGLYYRLFFFPDIRNANGLMRFGERCINSLLGRAKRRSAFARKSTLRLEVQRENTQEYIKSVQRDRLLEENEYFGIRKKVQTGTLFIAGIFLTECLLAYYSTLVLISGTDIDTALLRWLLATALTLGAITTSEKFLESCLPQRYRNDENAPITSFPVILLWALLMVLVLIGVIAVAEARVRDIEGGRTGSIVYYGFIALSTVLPLIAGTIAWEISRYYDTYKQTRRYRTAVRRLERLTSAVGQNAQQERESYSAMLTLYWDRYNDFRSFKEDYDQRHRTNGSVPEALSYDFEEFKRVSGMRYGQVWHDGARPDHSIAPAKLLRMPQNTGDTPAEVQNSFGDFYSAAFTSDDSADDIEKPVVQIPVRSVARARSRPPRRPAKSKLRPPTRKRRRGR